MMTDEELVQRWDEYVESMGCIMGDVERMAQEMRQHIKLLKTDRDELRNLLDAIVDEYEIEFGFTMSSIDAARDVLNKKL